MSAKGHAQLSASQNQTYELAMLGLGEWDRYSICFVFQISFFDLGDNLGRDLDRSFGPVDQCYAQLRNVELGLQESIFQIH